MHIVNLPKRSICYVSVGFGYEKNADDYKVVRVLSYYAGRPATIVEVYATKLSSWRDVKTDLRLNMTTCNCDAFVEGFAYWVIRNENKPCKTVLAAFDLRSEMVTALNISNMDILGTIPPQLGNLSFLISLDVVRNNRLHGDLPQELSHLHRLKVMDVGYNNFRTGEIPMCLGVFSELQMLILDNNSFTIIPPASISNLSKLEILSVSFKAASLRRLATFGV
ncbi:hypothetical protein T459_05360 [Capsicum annuum]|uniref:F-box associated beta-propeller type 1 domain-containing protein n=1 Tax=Capsicum annuum TaxID=4072 RepID=A0A2G3A7P6_CAPAN|nr:hypothetical protein T459_05360 [Capsicum annuum]